MASSLHSDSINFRKNIRLCYFFGAAFMFLPIIPVLVPYFLSLGFSMRQFLELQALFGLMVALFEVPSGYVADLFGRRRSLILGTTISALGFTYLIFATTYLDFVIHEALVAIGLSLASGADLALLYDHGASLEKVEGKGSFGSKLISRFFFFRLSGEAISAIIGGLLAFIDFKLAIIATALASWVSLPIVLAMDEPPVVKEGHGTHLENFKKVFTELFVNDSKLRLLFFNFVIWSLSTFCAIWIIQKYWSEHNLGLAWFGLLWAGFQLVAASIGVLCAQLEARFALRNLLFVSLAVTVFGYLAMGFSGAPLGIVIGVTFYVSRGLNQVLYGEAINRRIRSEFRATINSIYSLGFRLSFLVAGPLIGFGIDGWGLEWTLKALALSFAVLALMLYLPLYQKLGPSPEAS